MEILKQLDAKSKALRVIESCRTAKQIDVARNFLLNYHIKYEDELGYYELNRILTNKLKEIKNG